RVDFFQTFSPSPKMNTLRVLLHVAAQRDYELHSLNFSTDFLQGSLHEEIWLRRPPSLTGLRMTRVALGFAPSTSDPSLFLRTYTSVPPFYVLIYAELQERYTCTDLGPSALRLPRLLAIAHSSAYTPLALSSTFRRVRRAEWSYIKHGARAWRTGFSGTHRTLRCFLALEIRWLTYLLTDLGERPRSPPVLYVDKKAMLALCREQRLEHRTNQISLCYFLALVLQQRG
ncbi:unnamed protein product, partial [Closterium sp. NIES-53]